MRWPLARTHVVPPGVMSEYTEQIAALTGAQADYLQRASWSALQHNLDLQLNRLQSPRQCRVRTVTLLVPATPVHATHPTASGAPRHLPERRAPTPQRREQHSRA